MKQIACQYCTTHAPTDTDGICPECGAWTEVAGTLHARARWLTLAADARVRERAALREAARRAALAAPTYVEWLRITDAADRAGRD